SGVMIVGTKCERIVVVLQRLIAQRLGTECISTVYMGLHESRIGFNRLVVARKRGFELPDFRENDSAIAEPLRSIWIDCERLLVTLQRFVETPELQQRVATIIE